MNTALAATSALVALAFGLSTLDRWLRRGRRQDLAWTVAMALFGLASLALWWAQARGWSAASFRLFFALGAVVNVAWLALGTVYLLLGTRIGDIVGRWLLGLTGFSLGVILVAPLKAPVLANEFPTARKLFGVLPRVLAAVGSGVPALVIFVGAIWSAISLWRGKSPTITSEATREVRSPRALASGNILIAFGTVVLSASGTVAGRLGKDTAFVASLLVGISILFLGFLVATYATAARRTRQHFII
ncbi:MAG: hypothetical protein EXQ63_00215 [Ilumatobacteraceae bacterium]|nr:hypothetical protein [Ilumatobacteraceae bacterium]